MAEKEFQKRTSDKTVSDKTKVESIKVLNSKKQLILAF